MLGGFIPGNLLSELGNMAGGLLTDEVDQQQFLTMQQEAVQESDALVDKQGKVPGSLSLFNPFKVFRYSKFDPTGESYNLDLHFDTPNSSLSQNSILGAIKCPKSIFLVFSKVKPPQPTAANLFFRF